MNQQSNAYPKARANIQHNKYIGWPPSLAHKRGKHTEIIVVNQKSFSNSVSCNPQLSGIAICPRQPTKINPNVYLR